MPIVSTLRQPGRSRERIIDYGYEGCGKSTNLLSIARAIPDANFWALDNDVSYERLLETEFTDLTNVYLGGSDFCEGLDMNEWGDFTKALDHAVKNMTSNDWLVVDMVSKCWNMVQEWFIDGVFKKDMGEYFMMTRQAAKSDSKSLSALEGWKDWPVINANYNDKLATKLLKCPGHLYCAAEAQKISTEDDKGTRDLYGSIGCRPAGQKRSGHIMQTVLFNSVTRSGGYTLETVKDRGRVKWASQSYEDFAQDYLVNTAGWTVEKQFIKGE